MRTAGILIIEKSSLYVSVMPFVSSFVGVSSLFSFFRRATSVVEEGVPKEHLALLAVPMVPVQIILPLIISKYTAGPQPLNTFYKAMPFR